MPAGKARSEVSGAGVGSGRLEGARRAPAAYQGRSWWVDAAPRRTPRRGGLLGRNSTA